jgi:hypothetical protein
MQSYVRWAWWLETWQQRGRVVTQRSESRERYQLVDEHCVYSSGFDPPSFHTVEGWCSNILHTVTHELMVVQLSNRNYRTE